MEEEKGLERCGWTQLWLDNMTKDWTQQGMVTGVHRLVHTNDVLVKGLMMVTNQHDDGNDDEYDDDDASGFGSLPSAGSMFSFTVLPEYLHCYSSQAAVESHIVMGNIGYCV